MTSPTKVNSGSSRPVTSYLVKNAESRDVERAQLNRILAQIDSRLTLAEEEIDGIDTGGSDSGTATTYVFDSTQFTTTGSTTKNVSVSPGGISATELASNSVTTAKILDDAVTFAKIQNITSDRLLGRDAASSGDAEEISLDSTLEFTGSGSIRRAALTGDITASAGSNSTTLATVNSNVGSFGTASNVSTVTVNAKGLVTAASNTPIQITTSQVTGLDDIIADAEYAQSSGLKFGGVLSINGSNPARFDITAGSGEIVDYWTDITQPPVVTDVTWSAYTNQVVTNLATQTITYILIDSTGAIVQQNTPPTPLQKREYIFLGSLAHANFTTINNVINSPDIIHSPLSQARDLFGAIGIVNEGHTVSANGANLSINITEGYLFRLGANFRNDPQDPSRVYTAAKTAATIRRRTQTGNGATGVTTLDPGNYDVAGTITALSGTKYTNQRVYQQLSGNIIVQYGQAEYNSMASAVAAIGTETFVEFSNVQDTAVLIGVITVRSTATALNDSTQATFTRVSKFGETTGAGSGLQTLSLQQVYNNSSTPEILTDTTRGAVTVRRGSAADTDTVFEGQNGAGTTTFSVTGNGVINTASNIVMSDSDAKIISSTSDGADTSSVSLCGGGSNSPPRGAYIRAYGNEHATLPGDLILSSGNVAGAGITLTSNDTITTNNALSVGGAFNCTGNATLGDAAGDTITFNAAAWTLANNITVTGTWTNLGTVSTVDINGGTIDGTSVGATTPSTGAFTTLAANYGKFSGAIDSYTSANSVNISFESNVGTISATRTGGNFSSLAFKTSGADGNGVTRLTLATDGAATFSVAGTTRAVVSSTGLDVTGAISATATGAALTLSGATTSNRRIDISNTGGSLNFGVESSAGGAIITGSTAYAAVLNTGNTTPVQIGVNSVLVGSFTTTGLAVTGAISATTTVATGVYTVATLPAGVKGQRAFVSDANATTFASTVAGGGSNNVPVFYNGTNWLIG